MAHCSLYRALSSSSLVFGHFRSNALRSCLAALKFSEYQGACGLGVIVQVISGAWTSTSEDKPEMYLSTSSFTDPVTLFRVSDVCISSRNCW